MSVVEPMFRMAVSRLENAHQDLQRISAEFPSDAVLSTMESVERALDDLRNAQEFAASELGFEVKTGMKT